VAEGRLIPHHDEAIVLRTWPFHEADLLVSLFTRERGKVKGVARHAMRSRRRFGGALEPGTQVMAHYTERPREELVRMDSFEIVWSPLTAPVDALRAAGLALVVEVVEEAMPELAVEDNVFRLAVAVLRGMGGAADRHSPNTGLSTARTMGQSAPVEMTQQVRAVEMAEVGRDGDVWVAVTYFCVWMCRLMGWWPELAACAACGLDLRGQDVWWSPVADGVTCADDRRPQSRSVSAAAVAESYRMAKMSLEQFIGEVEQGRQLYRDLGVFAVAVLERHLERRIRSAAALG
jgi:DNA repair protein RecO (recombination protein O)